MTHIKNKLLTLLDDIHQNILTGTFETHELTVLYEMMSEFFCHGRPDKGLSIPLLSESVEQQETLSYLFLGWWIYYLKKKENE